jgi:tRNA threonylcarbamoyl adenosine modification protein YeaZ
MRTLVIDTATRACSVALFDHQDCIAGSFEEIGRGHAERLIPLIEALPGNGRADKVCVNIGPGSFTGIRVGIAAAKALALAWSVPVHGYGCLTLVAAMAESGGYIDVAMTGGHGEYFFQSFDGLTALDVPVSISLAEAAERSTAPIVAGDVANELVALRSSAQTRAVLPDARRWALIGSLPLLPASPYYGRAADAKPPGAIAP